MVVIRVIKRNPVTCDEIKSEDEVVFVRQDIVNGNGSKSLFLTGNY